MYSKFEDLLKDVGSKRPSQKSKSGKTLFFFNDHPVTFLAGEMDGVHWMDIQIEMPRFRLENLESARKILEANREMGAATPIPTWFGLSETRDKLIFINRLDWRHISAKILDEHIERCIEQMTQALVAERV